MTNTTSPYNISVSEVERRQSTDSTYSQTSSTRSHAPPAAANTHSSTRDAPPAYSDKSDPAEDEASESAEKVEEERKLRIRNYAMELSRLMGRQLVGGLKDGSDKKADAASKNGSES